MNKLFITFLLILNFAIFAEDFPECKEYSQLICDTCGAESETCTEGKARFQKCKENQNCQTNICKDSLNFAKKGNPDTVKQMMCAVRKKKK